MQKKINSGRSMIEMLGVLVIVGVLSIAALFGFTYAMNKYKANETIHDVMLRASNVPMIDEYYQIRPTGYGFKFPDLQDELSSMGYTMKTLKTDEFGYVYKVEAPSVPRRICSLILQMEPTDIDEIRIGTEKILYTAGHSELCEAYKDVSTESTMMSFYFEKACETNADCNNKCQECYQGRCKANYDLPGCGEDGDPEGTTCPTAPVCGECDIKVYDEDGCHIGCQTTSCCPAPECGPDDVFDEDSCSCVSGEEPMPDPGSGSCNPPCDECHVCDEAIGQCVMKACEIESCPEGQEASGHDDCGCIEGCVEKCPDLVCDEECTVPNYETCSCEYDTSCCPEFNGCDGCTEETVDENGCPICSEDKTITVFSGSCCLDEVTCCPLTDGGCTPSCTPSEDCDECSDGYLVEVALSEGNSIIGSGGGTVVTDGAVYCCLNSSMAGCGACNPVYYVPGEMTGNCEGCPAGLYEDNNGLWIDCVECTEDAHCDPNNCITCQRNKCSLKCEAGETCNGKGDCCSDGVGNDGECCPALTDPDCETETDDNGCSVCKQGCDPDTQQSCTNGTDTWCCDVGQMCGDTVGACTTCNAYSAQYDETLCEKCGWSWELSESWDYGATGHACGGTAFCEALLGTGAKWVQTALSGTLCEENHISFGCYEAGTWCWSYSGGYDDSCPMTEIRCGSSYEDVYNYCHEIAPSTGKWSCISIFQP